MNHIHNITSIHINPNVSGKLIIETLPLHPGKKFVSFKRSIEADSLIYEIDGQEMLIYDIRPEVKSVTLYHKDCSIIFQP